MWQKLELKQLCCKVQYSDSTALQVDSPIKTFGTGLARIKATPAHDMSSSGYSSASRSLSSDGAKNRRFDMSDSAKPFK
jgi:hypothetical protein